MKRLCLMGIACLAMASIICLMAASSNNTTDAERVDAFIKASKKLPVQERIQRAEETIQNSDDDVIVGEAARDLARFAKTPERAEETLSNLETLIKKSGSDSKAFHLGNLARARVLVRLGQTDTALSIFRAAVLEQWSENAYREFFESFEENGQYGFMAVEEYYRQTTDDYSEEVRQFHDLDGDLLDVLCHLRALRINDPDSSAMRDILPQLEESKRRPLAIRIAKALCLAGDELYKEALIELIEVENLLASESAPASSHDEYRDIPLYRAGILLFKGDDYEAVRDAYREYMKRNEIDPDLVLFRTRNLTYGMDETPNDIRKVAELTQVLVNSDWMATKEARGQRTEHLVASILEKHRESLAWRYEREESVRFGKLLMDEYYPQTLSGANAAMNYAKYIAEKNGDLDGAERILNDILERAPYDGVVPHVKRCLAALALARGDYKKSLALTDEILERLGPSPQGPLTRCLKLTLRTRGKALEASKEPQ